MHSECIFKLVQSCRYWCYPSSRFSARTFTPYTELHHRAFGTMSGLQSDVRFSRYINLLPRHYVDCVGNGRVLDINNTFINSLQRASACVPSSPNRRTNTDLLLDAKEFYYCNVV